MLTNTNFQFFIFDHNIGRNYLTLIAVLSFHPLLPAVYSHKVILITIFKLLLMYIPFHNYTFFSSRFLVWDLQKIILGLRTYLTSSFLMRNPLLCDRWLRRKWLMTLTKKIHIHRPPFADFVKRTQGVTTWHQWGSWRLSILSEMNVEY